MLSSVSDELAIPLCFVAVSPGGLVEEMSNIVQSSMESTFAKVNSHFVAL